MRHPNLRSAKPALALAAVIMGALGWGATAGANDAPAGTAPSAQMKVDAPFVKSIVGTWAWTSKPATGEPEKGTETFRLGLLDTAVLDDIEGTAMGQPFQGHGIWKIADGGASMTGWWFFSAAATPKAFQGTITADGYDLKSEGDERMTLLRTPGGMEMRAYKGAVLMRTVTFTKK